MEQDLQHSLDLLKENEEQVRKNAENALFSICQNILSYPNEHVHRNIRLDDPLVTSKLLPALGAIECLFNIGFVEGTDCFSLPQEAPLTKLKSLQCSLRKNAPPKSPIYESTKLYNVLPPASTKEEAQFFKTIIHRFESVMQYEDEKLQEKAKKVIPIVDLEIATMTRIRQLHKLAKLNQSDLGAKNKREYNDIDDAKDLFLMELLHWFKYKFFTWIDSPKCTACFSECMHYETLHYDDPRCSRIEIHKCTKCATSVNFPRYNDAEPLLTLRRGRCGEWANVFTLMCRSLGYDTRYILDDTDHIWTEVWSIHEKRWIHLDPCEDVMDRPLMYEKGWKKKLSYIIAFSKDEVQDVTWRYTRDQLGVMKRRNKCSETKLLHFIESLNNYHQTSPNYNSSRRQYVIKRRLFELVELIQLPNKQNSYDDGNYQGRSTGSYEWKLARGEITQASSKTNYIWDITKYGDVFNLHYSIIKDSYQVLNHDGTGLMELSDWENGTNEVQGGIFRKVEHDWKVAYLARSPDSISGQIKWCFAIMNPKLCIKSFNLRAVTKIFHDATVSWKLEAFLDHADQNKSVIFIIDDCSNYYTDQLKGAVRLILTAFISGGQGNCAWQHAQLFRQSLECKEDRSLTIMIQSENRC